MQRIVKKAFHCGLISTDAPNGHELKILVPLFSCDDELHFICDSSDNPRASLFNKFANKTQRSTFLSSSTFNKCSNNRTDQCVCIGPLS